MTLLKQPNELTNKTIFSGLIYGQPGIGKTTLALSSKNPVCIDTDKGMYRVEKRFQVSSLQVENYGQVIELITGSELDNFDTIIFDTIGKLVDRIGDYVTNENPKLRQGNGQLTMQGWGQVKIVFSNLLKLIQGKNKAVVFVAHESEEKNGDNTKKRPDVSGSARKDIVKELDWMGYMEASGNKRTICFNPTEKFYAKNSIGMEGIIEVPDVKNGNTFIKEKIVGAIAEKQTRDDEMMKKYERLKSEINAIIESCDSIVPINQIIGTLSNLEIIWDSKRYAWKTLNDKAENLGLSYNSSTKNFEAK